MRNADIPRLAILSTDVRVVLIIGGHSTSPRVLLVLVMSIQILLAAPGMAVAEGSGGPAEDHDLLVSAGSTSSPYAYRSYGEIKSILTDIAMQHGDIALVLDIGDSWEKSEAISDRDILALKISDNVALDEGEPQVLILGLHHAREWPTSEIVVELARTLTSAYGNDSRISWLVDNREVWLVPVVNPDGLDYALSVDELWRKNRRANHDGTFGVDLNRNYNGSENGDPEGAWGGAGSSHDTSSEVYCGLYPFSEPEAQAVRDLVLQRDFRLALDFHTFGDLVLWPWGFTDAPTPDNEHFVRIGQELAALNGYTPKQSVELYPTTGDSIDWLYGGSSVFALCIEVGNEQGTIAERFHPTEQSVVQGLIDENILAALEAIEIAGDREERWFQISHTSPDTVSYSPTGHEVKADITAGRGVDVSSLSVAYGLGGGPWQVLSMAKVEGNDTYAATIPSQPVGSTVEYYITARDLAGVQLLEPAYAPYVLHSLSVVDAQMDDPPAIEHQPRNATDTGDTAFAPSVGTTLWARVVDDLGLETVACFYRPLGAGGDFTPVSMSCTYGDPWHAGTVTGEIGSSFEYYIEALDSIGQVARSPADAPATLYVWYNEPPEVVSFALPGSPPGTVYNGSSLNLSIECADDYLVHKVFANVTWPSGGGLGMELEIISGNTEHGVWAGSTNISSGPGTIQVDITVSDGTAETYLNGTELVLLEPMAPTISHTAASELSSEDPKLVARVSDDVGVARVVCAFALGGSAEFSEAVMTLVSGDGLDGVYECVLNLSGYLGTVRYYFVASDGTLTTTLPSGAPGECFSTTVIDPTPLEVLFVPPSFADGSTQLVLTAIVGNMTDGAVLEVRVVDADTGAVVKLVMTSTSEDAFSASIASGQLEGYYIVCLTAWSGGDMIWSSALHTLLVEDLTAPAVSAPRASLISNDTMGFNLACADVYGVQSVTLYYRPFGEGSFFQATMELYGGTTKNGNWSCEVPVAVYTGFDYYFEASDGRQSSRLPADGTFLTFALANDDYRPSEGDDGSGNALVLWVLGMIAVAAAISLAFLLVTRAGRPSIPSREDNRSPRRGKRP